MDFQNRIKGWITESDEWWTSHSEPQCSKRQEGKDTEREREEFPLLFEPPPRLISVGWWLKQPLQLTKLPFPCQCEILCLTATHSPKAHCLAAQESKAIVPEEGGADMTAVLREKKRGHWLSRLWLFFAVQRRLRCYTRIQSGMRTLEENEGRQKCLSVDNGNLCVAEG